MSIVFRGLALSELADHHLLKLPPLRSLAMRGCIAGVVFYEFKIQISFVASVDVADLVVRLGEYLPSKVIQQEDDRAISIRLITKPTSLNNADTRRFETPPA